MNWNTLTKLALFLLGAVLGAAAALHWANEKVDSIIAVQEDTAAQWERLATECRAQFDSSTVLYEVETPALRLASTGLLSQFEIRPSGALAGFGAEIRARWYIPARVTPVSYARGVRLLYAWHNSATGQWEGPFEALHTHE